MHFSPATTSRIALFSMLFMLMSVFALNGAAMAMTFSNLTTNSSSQIQHQMMTADTMATSCHNVEQSVEPNANPHAQHTQASPNHASPTQVSPDQTAQHCDSNNEVAHSCCGSACFNVMAHVPEIGYTLSHITALALIVPEQRSAIISRASSLYRPPIA